MESFLTSTFTVALAEIGDKTQLLSLVLAARFRNKWAIIGGILAATILNHGLSAWLGNWLAQFLQSNLGQILIGGSFIALALWLLIPDKDEDINNSFDKFGAFWVSTILFFLAEIGDKTQIATVLLGAQFESVIWVTIGTTLGMLIANVPVVFAGDYLMKKIPLNVTRAFAAAAFALVGLFHIFG
ncbi:TMEM165/GDT1 family protein [Aliikangiella marina]|uniref:GDT1 family protein n=1 Tax=Aliikangiella marina TaxID=1712262 RepID=A0A545T7C0_9GAMM|nr:TMEM165/GDT1 family protein [Aliikangiella marina]TQV73119.1 TMEM165/GDT1 family protein [Aliikangiella marina]